jgi:pyridoxal biosynthesis lyase PdxS
MALERIPADIRTDGGKFTFRTSMFSFFVFGVV